MCQEAVQDCEDEDPFVVANSPGREPEDVDGGVDEESFLTHCGLVERDLGFDCFGPRFSTDSAKVVDWLVVDWIEERARDHDIGADCCWSVEYKVPDDAANFQWKLGEQCEGLGWNCWRCWPRDKIRLAIAWSLG